MIPTSDIGVDGFMNGLRRCGLEPIVDSGVVTFKVEAPTGARAGTPVPTGVSADELTGWPAIPPHWVHFPENVNFPRSNTQGSLVAGWLKHSRQIQGWGNAVEPAQAWISHVRSVLSEAA